MGGLLWQFGGAGTKGVLQIGVLTILARLISPEDFGIVGAAMVVIGFSDLFSQFGVGPALVHQGTLRDQHVRVGFSITCLLSIMTAALVWLASSSVAAFFRMPDLEAVVVVLSLVFILKGLGVVAESLLQRELAFQKLATLEVISFALGYGVLATTLGFLGYGYWALVAGHIGQTAIQTVGLFGLRRHPVTPSMDWGAARDLLYFGGGHTLAKVANFAALQGDNLVVGRALGAVALGIYGRAYQLLVIPAQLFGRVLDRVLFPTMASIQDDTRRLAAAYRRSVAAVALVAIPASGIMFLLAPEIVFVLLGDQWTEVILPLQVFAFGILFRTSYKISDSLARATGSVYRRAWRQWVYSAMVFAGALIGMRWGVAGVVGGVLGAIFGNFLLMAHLSLTVVQSSWREFALAHVPGLNLGLVLTLVATAVTIVLRAENAPPIVILIAVAGVLLFAARILLGRYSRIFLGADGVWAFDLLARNLPARLVNLIRPRSTWSGEN